MAVYVDDFRYWEQVGLIRARWSHLIADSREELHDFARRLGLQRSWFQDPVVSGKPLAKPGSRAAENWHYDVTDTKRALAIKLGARPITCAQLHEIIDARVLRDHLAGTKFLHAAHIATVCQQAAARTPGDAVVDEPEPSEQGVRVRLSSQPHQQAAVHALREQGYRVFEDTDPDDDHSVALLVTGWDTDLLVATIARLAEARHDVQRNADTWGERALAHFRWLISNEHLHPDTAYARTIAEAGQELGAHPGPGNPPAHHEPGTDDNADVRALLERLTAARDAAAALRGDVQRAAASAIERFRHSGDHHPGHDESAASSASTQQTDSPSDRAAALGQLALEFEPPFSERTTT